MTLLYASLVSVFGLIIGSFLNVVIYRGPTNWKLVNEGEDRGNLAAPRSNCPSCKTPIKAVHLIPILSFALLRGRCAACGARISTRYPIVELLAAVAALLAFILFGLTSAGVMAAVFSWILIALAAIDHETGYLPDALTLPLLVIGLGANFFALFAPLSDALIGAAVGYLSFRLIGAAFFWLRDIEGLGQGDAKLLAAIGAWLGWLALAPVVLIATVFAFLGVLFMRMSGAPVRADTEIHFGPALAIAAWLFMMLTASANKDGIFENGVLDLFAAIFP